MSAKFVSRHAAACVYCAHGPKCRACVIELPLSDPARWSVCEPHQADHRAIVSGDEPLPAPRLLHVGTPQEPPVGSRRTDRYGRLWVRTYVPHRDGIRVLWACWDKDLPAVRNPVHCSWSNMLRWLADD